jgi:hypothetical protein
MNKGPRLFELTGFKLHCAVSLRHYVFSLVILLNIHCNTPQSMSTVFNKTVDILLNIHCNTPQSMSTVL